MKERYIKPSIIFESFSLTQTIARYCGASHSSTVGAPTHDDESTCEWDLGDDYYLFFTGINPNCIEGPEDQNDPFEFEAICYNNPEGGQEVFSS